LSSTGSNTANASSTRYQCRTLQDTDSHRPRSRELGCKTRQPLKILKIGSRHCAPQTRAYVLLRTDSVAPVTARMSPLNAISPRDTHPHTCRRGHQCLTDFWSIYICPFFSEVARDIVLSWEDYTLSQLAESESEDVLDHSKPVGLL
jgi:hypothetical protein